MDTKKAVEVKEQVGAAIPEAPVAAETQAVAPVVTAPPAVQHRTPRGLEREVDAEDIIIPRAKLLQPGSPEVTAQMPGQAPTNWAGQVVDTLTKEVLPMEFIPIIYTKEWIRFNPTKADDFGFDKDFEPGKPIWRSSDSFDPRVQKEGKFGPNGERPLATSFLNFLCLFPGHSTPAVIGFKGSSYAAGKKLLNLIQRTKDDAFKCKYRLTIEQKQGPNKSTFFVLDVEPLSPASEAEFAECEQLWEKFHARPPKIDDAGISDDVAQTDAPVASGPVDPARPY